MKLGDMIYNLSKTEFFKQKRLLRVLSNHFDQIESITSGTYFFSLKMKIQDVSFTFFLRKGTSDIPVFEQVILNNEYSVLLPCLKKITPNALSIIDAGGNIGLTSIYLTGNFSNSQIIALEPSLENIAQAQKNFDINKLTNINLIPKGLYTKSTFLVPDRSFRDGQDWSFALKESEDAKDNGIPTISLSELIEDAGWETVDLLKIDIEGGEAPLLRDDDFLNTISKSVKLLAMEVHPEVISHQQAYLILNEAGFYCFPSGELTIGLNLKYYQKDGTLLSENE